MKINKTKLDVVFKLVLSFSFILIALSVSYYFFIFLPKIEQGKFELAKQEQERKAEIAEEERQNKQKAEEKKQKLEEEKQEQEIQAMQLKEAKTKDAKINLEYCLGEVERMYAVSWDSSCKTHIKTNEEELKDCLAYYTTKSMCDIYKVKYDSNDTCLLPKTKSESIEERREKNKEECYLKYELELKAIN